MAYNPPSHGGSLWADHVADDLVGVVSDGADVTSWAGRVGPTLIGEGSGGPGAGTTDPQFDEVDPDFNGHAAVDFNGTFDAMGVDSLTGGGFTSEFTVFAVVCPDSASSSQGVVSFYTSSTTRSAMLTRRDITDLMTWWDSTGGWLHANTLGAVSVSPTYSVLAWRFDGSDSGQEMKYYKDGSSETDAHASTIPAWDTYTVGNGGATTSSFNGNIARIITYDTALTDAQIEAIIYDLYDEYDAAPSAAPATPTVTVDRANETSVDASTSAFVAGESGGTHTDTQWQITTAADTGFASPVYNPGDDATNLTSILSAGSGVPLQADTDYLIRARHREDDATYSAWSTAVAFTTAFNSGVRYYPVVQGDVMTMSVLFVKESASDDTEADVYMYRHDNAKNILGSLPLTMGAWSNAEDGSRKQTTAKVGIGLTPAERLLLRYVSFRITVRGNNGETAGLDYWYGWKNAPDFGLTAVASLDGTAADFSWETAIQAQVMYVANTTGYVSSATVEATGTFTTTTEETSDTEEDVLTGLSSSDVVYITLVPFDEDGKRSGPRYLVPTVTVP